MHPYKSVVLYSVFLLLFWGCATFRSSMSGKFDSIAERNYNARSVNVGFVFSHYRQGKGMDVIPKLDDRNAIVKGFDDLMLDALTEFSNVKNYTTFTNYASDVNESRRRLTRDSIASNSDYLLEIKILRTKSFAKHFFGVFVSTISLTLLPVPYKNSYSFKVEVYDKKHTLLKSYSRDESTTKWLETLLIFLYPFYPESRVREELYVNCLHDIFRQIESEKILN